MSAIVSLSRRVESRPVLSSVRPHVLFVSPDSLLIVEVQRVFECLDLPLEVAVDVERALEIMGALPSPGIILLDGRLPGMKSGGLLASIHEQGLHARYTLALVADEVSDEWIARLREGAIDDIVPRHSDVSAWCTHMNTMQRGHELLCELQRLRESAAQELEHDPASGAFSREAMLSLLFRETDRVQRLRGALSVVLLEIDDLAHWRNELGREACDGVLREFCQRSGRLLRSYDLLGRVSRDEFLIALPGCSTINAVLLAERLRMDVMGEPFAVRCRASEETLVRMSATFAITASRGRSPVVVLREAEATLAEARSAGPDSIQCAGEMARGQGQVHLTNAKPIRIREEWPAW